MVEERMLLLSNCFVYHRLQYRSGSRPSQPVAKQWHPTNTSPQRGNLEAGKGCAHGTAQSIRRHAGAENDVVQKKILFVCVKEIVLNLHFSALFALPSLPGNKGHSSTSSIRLSLKRLDRSRICSRPSGLLQLVMDHGDDISKKGVCVVLTISTSTDPCSVE